MVESGRERSKVVGNGQEWVAIECSGQIWSNVGKVVWGNWGWSKVVGIMSKQKI